MLEYPENIDENIVELEKMQKIIDSIGGIDREEMLDAFMVLAEETIALLIQVFADTKAQNTSIMEDIDAMRTAVDIQAQREKSSVVAAMVIEDEVDRLIVEDEL